MLAGMQVLNDSGVIQIDENTLNFVLASKGTATCTTRLGPSPWAAYYVDIVVTGVCPMLALQSSSDVAVVSQTVSGFTWTFRVAGVDGMPFNYFVFDLALGTYSGVGFAFYTSAGVLGYHSDAKPMRVVDFVARGDGDSYTYTSGREYAVIQSNPGAGQTAPDDITGEFDNLLAASAVSGHTVYTREFVTRHGISGSIGGDYAADVRFIVVDVTHF